MDIKKAEAEEEAEWAQLQILYCIYIVTYVCIENRTRVVKISK